jgi:hypothetical protein
VNGSQVGSNGLVKSLLGTVTHAAAKHGGGLVGTNGLFGTNGLLNGNGLLGGLSVNGNVNSNSSVNNS